MVVVNFDTSEFRRAFGAAARAVAKKNPKEVLRKVHVSVTRGAATFTGGDGEIQITSALVGVGTTGETGEFLLPADRVSAILGTLDGTELTIRASESKVTMRCGGAKFELLTERPDEYPVVYDVENAKRFTVHARDLIDGIRKTSFVCDESNARYALGSVLFCFEGDLLVLVATDGRRLAKTIVGAVTEESGHMPTRQILIQKKAVDLLATIAGEVGSVVVTLSESKARFEMENTTLSCQQAEGRFPRYRDVMPEKFPSNVEIPIVPFHGAIRSMLTIASAESRSVKLSFGNGELLFLEEVEEVGAAEARIPVPYEGENTLRLDAKYVDEFFPRMRAYETFLFRFTDGEKAVEMSNESGTFRYVVMPLSE